MKTILRNIHILLSSILITVGFTNRAYSESLSDARQSFATRLVKTESAKVPTEKPPAGVFNLVKYKSDVGDLDAYLTPDPKDGKKRPAIIWITGGDCSTIGDVWTEAPDNNDQTASSYRKAGIVMMFPSLRGGNMNPGFHEGFYGEVNDVLAAAEYLAKQPHVDPKRIYLGGHSTGGTLALLVAECSDRFRAIISFGPVSSPISYGADTISMPFAMSANEIKFRSPGMWLDCITTPTYVFEGSRMPGNAEELRAMSQAIRSETIKFTLLQGNHFSILAQSNQLLAQKILADTGKAADLSFSDAEIKSLALPVNRRTTTRPASGAVTKPTSPATRQAGPKRQTSAIIGTKGQSSRKFMILDSEQLNGFYYKLSDSGQLADLNAISSTQTSKDIKTGYMTERPKEGYAIYGAQVAAANSTIALQVVYARVKQNGMLDPQDTYFSDWIGKQAGEPVSVGCDGIRKIVGATMYYQEGTICGISFSVVLEGAGSAAPAK